MSTEPHSAVCNDSVCFDFELIRRYGGHGPRYTSYPTALQFDDTLTLADYRENALASNAGNSPLSLYVHIPFCRTLCYYCGCNKIVTRNQARVTAYLRNLHREIRMQAELFGSERVVEQLHLGGGTPTYLDDMQLRGLVESLCSNFNLDDSDNRQFSIEVDPRTVDECGIQLLADLGFNRLSIGVQDFDPVVQEAVNRKQATADVIAVVDAARNAGFKSISFDLIYGLPHQGVAGFGATLDRVVEMRPDRVAVYNYAHLPHRFRGQRMINADDIPTPETKLDILQHTVARLGEAGYVYIGMDHFALPEDDLVTARHNGTLQRNFQGYSTHGHCDLVGLGVSSISHIDRVFSQNSTTTMEYEAMIEDGRLPIRKGIAVDDDDQLRANAMQALMCYDELRYDTFNTENDVDFRIYFAAEIGRLKRLADDELVEIDREGIHVKPKGRLLLRNIAMAFDRYADDAGNDNRFSRTI